MAAIAALPTTTLRRNNNNKGVSSLRRSQICLLTWPLSGPPRVDFTTCLKWTRGHQTSTRLNWKYTLYICMYVCKSKDDYLPLNIVLGTKDVST